MHRYSVSKATYKTTDGWNMTFNNPLSRSSLSRNADPWTHPHPLLCVSFPFSRSHTLVLHQLLCSYLSLSNTTLWQTESVQHEVTNLHLRLHTAADVEGSSLRVCSECECAVQHTSYHFKSSDWGFALLRNTARYRDRLTDSSERDGEQTVIQAWTQRYKHSWQFVPFQPVFKCEKQHLDKYFTLEHSLFSVV